MDNDQEKESAAERKGVNTEYQPTKCRVTKPPPPKPATNPLQFIKVAPCPLFQKAHEQIKKVEQIKKERKETREEAEDWQQNLDNWKSCRRKRQEHIIERVVEVKKLEQEEHEKNRRRIKTFSEMMEDRGRHKFSIPVYDDDSNDLSDYGIGSSSSKANSLKDNDTDDSSSLLDDKDYLNKESNASNQSQSEDETKPTKNANNNTESFTKAAINDNYSKKDDSQKAVNKSNKFIPKVATNGKPSILSKKSVFENSNGIEPSFNKETEQYTYEGAIQDYRSRIQSKIHVDESIFTKNKNVSKSKEFSEAQAVLPKGEIFKRKELFESEKHIEINHMESNSSRRLSEDFANSKSIKDRLKCLEMSTDHSTKKIDKNDIQVSVKQRLENLNKLNESDNKPQTKPAPNKISNYLLDKSQSTPSLNAQPANKSWKVVEERSSSPETELYMSKLNMFNQEFDNLVGNKPNLDHLDDYSNYPPSTSSIELTGLSSDREDSGIHTADVSCSVSQADEAIDTDTEFNTIPNCIDKLNKEKELINKELKSLDDNNSKEIPAEVSSPVFTKEILDLTRQFLEMEIKEAAHNFDIKVENKVETTVVVEKENNNLLNGDNSIEDKNEITNNINMNGIIEDNEVTSSDVSESKPIYENIDFNYDFNNFIVDTPFTLPPKTMEPPKVKPPPPPPPESEPHSPIRRLNSTKRIKKEIHIKRSSFLGLDEPTDDQIDPDMIIDKPPDINSFLQKESKSEKSLYKKILEENRPGGLSKVESQDSGLDIDRGRLSSDTWCSSSIGESGTHERQDSEQTNSITSEEDEITKKEREIIEMVEKEEKSRDSDFNNHDNHCKEESKFSNIKENDFDANLGSEQFKNPYFPPNDFNIDDQDSEVLKVEHELRQLEQEELERQRENLLFRESRFKARLNNRRSLENICDEIYPNYVPENDYRKSMPELQLSPLKPELKYRPVIDNVSYRKSMPDIQQHNYQLLEPRNNDNYHPIIDHRKSMPELGYPSAFKSPPLNRQPIMPGKPLRAKDALLFNSAPTELSRQPLSKNNLQALSAIPRNRHVQGDNWIQPKSNPEAKSYNQHWLFQEAELRRLSDQQKNRWQSQQRPEKHLPDSIIQSLTQRVQTRSNFANNNNNITDQIQRNQIRRSETTPNIQQHQYMNNQTMGHALPRNYGPPIKDETPDRMLSVSGKKKCSYCGNELGRGAAMIIESLCLFYHMECFKCCVCHMQLGNGLMGTDVRVRNQKLHCHNCYSSDDGVKFSCV